MSKKIWWITYDYVSEDHVVKHEAPVDAEGSTSFRIYDDDGELYFKGACRLDEPGVTGFEPLSWAQNNAGATEIQYHENGESGKWVTL